MAEVSEERIQAVEDAFKTMKERGWGFASSGKGFGDPSAICTMVGPIRDGVVEVYGADKDCVEAVKKAVDRAESHNLS